MRREKIFFSFLSRQSALPGIILRNEKDGDLHLESGHKNAKERSKHFNLVYIMWSVYRDTLDTKI